MHKSKSGRKSGQYGVPTHVVARQKTMKKNPNARSCTNCVEFHSGVCDVLSAKLGQTYRIASIGNASKCMFFKLRQQYKHH